MEIPRTAAAIQAKSRRRLRRIERGFAVDCRSFAEMVVASQPPVVEFFRVGLHRVASVVHMTVHG